MVALKKRPRLPAAAADQSFEVLWDPAPRRRRGPVAAIGRTDVVRTAIAIADDRGLAAVTMDRVSAALGVTTMALYRHLPGKHELVDLMTDAVFAGAPRTAGADWRRGLARWARADLALFQRHPWLHESMTYGTAVGPNWLDWLESALRALTGAAMTPKEKMSVILLIDGHARASAQLTSGAKTTGRWAANFARAHARALPDPRYRALAALTAAGRFDPPLQGKKSAFEFGLERLLDGVAAHVRRTPRRRSARTPGR